MQMMIYKKIRRMAESRRRVLVIVLPLIIMSVYLGCECAYGIDGASFYIYPAAINGLMIFSAYLAWRGYAKEDSPVVFSCLMLGIAVILPFSNKAGGGSGDWAERAFEFVWVLWPVPLICLGNYCMRRITENKKIVCGADLALIFLSAMLLHALAAGKAGELPAADLLVPAIWLAEGALWIFALNFTDHEKNRKRNLMAAWASCLLLFWGFTFADISYLSSPDIWDLVRGNYWNRTVFLCSPVIMLMAAEMPKIYIPESSRRSAQKQRAIYALIVLPVIYFIVNKELNFETGLWKYNMAEGAYLLALAEIILCKELYGEPSRGKRRLRGAAFISAINVGALLLFWTGNRRLREICFYIKDFFAGKLLHNANPAVPEADWFGYRKAVFEAFLSKNLTVLEKEYANGGYPDSIYGHGLASIRFQYGLLPLLVMSALLILLVILLLNWDNKDFFVMKCAGYLAISYALKASIALILQINMIVSPYMEFPFSGMDMAEVLLPALLAYESCRREIDA